MFNYRCYGLEIASEVELPALLPSDGLTNDVEVFLRRSVFFEKEGAKHVNGFWISDQKEVFFEVDFGCMLISGGNKIEFSLDGNSSLEEAVQHILGSGIAAILIQQKKLVLHASVVAKEDKAILFMGRSGAGKSSTAWTCVQNGYSALSDDLAVIEFENGTPFVNFGYPRSKIAEDVILEKELAIDKKEQPFSEGRSKYFRYPERFIQSSLPVANIFLLVQKEISTPKVSGNMDRIRIFQAMYRNSFRFSLIKPLGFSNLHLQLCKELFRKVEVKSIKIPNNKLMLNSTFELIEQQLK